MWCCPGRCWFEVSTSKFNVMEEDVNYGSDNKLRSEPRVVISKRDRQVAEFYLRIRTAWNIKTLHGKPLKKTITPDDNLHKTAASESLGSSLQNDTLCDSSTSPDASTSGAASSNNAVSNSSTDTLQRSTHSKDLVSNQTVLSSEKRHRSLVDKRQQIQCTLKKFKQIYLKGKDGKAWSLNTQGSPKDSSGGGLLLPDRESGADSSVDDAYSQLPYSNEEDLSPSKSKDKAESALVRYIPNGRCCRLNTDGCIIAQRICNRKVLCLPPPINKKPGPSTSKQRKEQDLPDLGSGVVDALNDLVSDQIQENDIFTSTLDNSSLSAEALLEFTVVPEKGSLNEDQMWGFSDTDPSDLLYTEERDLYDDCGETVGRIKRVGTRRPRYIVIPYGLQRAAVIEECHTENPVHRNPVNMRTATVQQPVIVMNDSAVVTEEVTGTLSTLQATPVNKIDTNYHVRDTAMLKHSTEPRTLTQHASFVEQPSIESLLTCIDCKIADDSYPETARPLHCRLHVDIQEAAKDEIEVHQHYEMKNAVIRLPDLAIQHPEFMDDYVSDRPYIAIFRPSVQPLLLDGTYANLASAFSQSEKPAKTQPVKQKPFVFSVPQTQKKSFSILSSGVIEAASAESKVNPYAKVRKPYMSRFRPKTTTAKKADVPLATDEDKRLFTRFERISASQKSEKSVSSNSNSTNAFHSSSLDEILRTGRSTIKSEPIPHPILGEAGLHCDEDMQFSGSGSCDNDRLCISQVWSMDSQETNESTKWMNKATKSVSSMPRKGRPPKAGNKAAKSTSKQKLINKMMRWDKSLKNAHSVRNSIQQGTARKSTTSKAVAQPHHERQSLRNIDNHIDNTDGKGVKEAVSQPKTRAANSCKTQDLLIINWYRNANKKILAHDPITYQDMSDPMYLFISEIGAHKTRGLSDTLNRGGNVIEALKRIFVIQLVQKIIIQRRHREMKKRLELLKAELSRDSRLENYLSSLDKSKDHSGPVKKSAAPVTLPEWQEPLMGPVYENDNNLSNFTEAHMFSDLIDELDTFQDDGGNENEEIIRDIIEKMLKDIETGDSMKEPSTCLQEGYTIDVVQSVLAMMVDQITTNCPSASIKREAEHTYKTTDEEKEVKLSQKGDYTQVRNTQKVADGSAEMMVKSFQQTELKDAKLEENDKVEALMDGPVHHDVLPDTQSGQQKQSLKEAMSPVPSDEVEEQAALKEVLESILKKVEAAIDKPHLDCSQNSDQTTQYQPLSDCCTDDVDEQTIVVELIESIVGKVVTNKDVIQNVERRQSDHDAQLNPADEASCVLNNRISLMEGSHASEICQLTRSSPNGMKLGKVCDSLDKFEGSDLYDEVFTCQENTGSAIEALVGREGSMDSTVTDDLYGDLEQFDVCEPDQSTSPDKEEDYSSHSIGTMVNADSQKSYDHYEESESDDEKLVINEVFSENMNNALPDNYHGDDHTDDENALIIDDDTCGANQSESALTADLWSSVSPEHVETVQSANDGDLQHGISPGSLEHLLSCKTQDFMSSGTDENKAIVNDNENLVGCRTSLFHTGTTRTTSISHLCETDEVIAEHHSKSSSTVKSPDCPNHSLEDNAELVSVFLGSKSSEQNHQVKVSHSSSTLALNVLDFDQEDIMPPVFKDKSTNNEGDHQRLAFSETDSNTCGVATTCEIERTEIWATATEPYEENQSSQRMNENVPHLEETKTAVGHSTDSAILASSKEVDDTNVEARDSPCNTPISTHGKSIDNELPPLIVPVEVPPTQYTHRDVPSVLGLRRMKNFSKDSLSAPKFIDTMAKKDHSTEQGDKLENDNADDCSEVINSVINHMKYVVEVFSNQQIDHSQIEEFYKSTSFVDPVEVRLKEWPDFPHRVPKVCFPSFSPCPSPESATLTNQMNMETAVCVNDFDGVIQNICSLNSCQKKTVAVEQRDIERMSHQLTYQKLEQLRKGLLSVIKSCGASGTYYGVEKLRIKQRRPQPSPSVNGSRQSNRIKQRPFITSAQREEMRVEADHTESKQITAKKVPKDVIILKPRTKTPSNLRPHLKRWQPHSVQKTDEQKEIDILLTSSEDEAMPDDSPDRLDEAQRDLSFLHANLPQLLTLDKVPVSDWLESIPKRERKRKQVHSERAGEEEIEEMVRAHREINSFERHNSNERLRRSALTYMFKVLGQVTMDQPGVRIKGKLSKISLLKMARLMIVHLKGAVPRLKMIWKAEVERNEVLFCKLKSVIDSLTPYRKSFAKKVLVRMRMLQKQRLNRLERAQSEAAEEDKKQRKRAYQKVSRMNPALEAKRLAPPPIFVPIPHKDSASRLIKTLTGQSFSKARFAYNEVLGKTEEITIDIRDGLPKVMKNFTHQLKRNNMEFSKPANKSAQEFESRKKMLGMIAKMSVDKANSTKTLEPIPIENSVATSSQDSSRASNVNEQVFISSDGHLFYASIPGSEPKRVLSLVQSGASGPSVANSGSYSLLKSANSSTTNIFEKRFYTQPLPKKVCIVAPNRPMVTDVLILPKQADNSSPSAVIPHNRHASILTGRTSVPDDNHVHSSSNPTPIQHNSQQRLASGDDLLTCPNEQGNASAETAVPNTCHTLTGDRQASQDTLSPLIVNTTNPSTVFSNIAQDLSCEPISKPDICKPLVTTVAVTSRKGATKSEGIVIASSSKTVMPLSQPNPPSTLNKTPKTQSTHQTTATLNASTTNSSPQLVDCAPPTGPRTQAQYSNMLNDDTEQKSLFEPSCSNNKILLGSVGSIGSSIFFKQSDITESSTCPVLTLPPKAVTIQSSSSSLGGNKILSTEDATDADTSSRVVSSKKGTSVCEQQQPSRYLNIAASPPADVSSCQPLIATKVVILKPPRSQKVYQWHGMSGSLVTVKKSTDLSASQPTKPLSKPEPVEKPCSPDDVFQPLPVKRSDRQYGRSPSRPQRQNIPPIKKWIPAVQVRQYQLALMEVSIIEPLQIHCVQNSSVKRISPSIHHQTATVQCWLYDASKKTVDDNSYYKTTSWPHRLGADNDQGMAQSVWNKVTRPAGKIPQLLSGYYVNVQHLANNLHFVSAKTGRVRTLPITPATSTTPTDTFRICQAQPLSVNKADTTRSVSVNSEGDVTLIQISGNSVESAGEEPSTSAVTSTNNLSHKSIQSLLSQVCPQHQDLDLLVSQQTASVVLRTLQVPKYPRKIFRNKTTQMTVFRDETLADLYCELGPNLPEIAKRATHMLHRSYTATTVKTRLVQLGIIPPNSRTKRKAFGDEPNNATVKRRRNQNTSELKSGKHRLTPQGNVATEEGGDRDGSSVASIQIVQDNHTVDASAVSTVDYIDLTVISDNEPEGEQDRVTGENVSDVTSPVVGPPTASIKLVKKRGQKFCNVQALGCGKYSVLQTSSANISPNTSPCGGSVTGDEANKVDQPSKGVQEELSSAIAADHEIPQQYSSDIVIPLSAAPVQTDPEVVLNTQDNPTSNPDT